MSDEKPLLELKTAPLSKLIVAIDGEKYGLEHPNDLSLRHLVMIDRLRMKLGNLDAMAEEEVTKLADGLQYLFDNVLLAPPEIRQKLNSNQRIQILSLYLKGK